MVHRSPAVLASLGIVTLLWIYTSDSSCCSALTTFKPTTTTTRSQLASTPFELDFTMTTTIPLSRMQRKVDPLPWHALLIPS